MPARPSRRDALGAVLAAQAGVTLAGPARAAAGGGAASAVDAARGVLRRRLGEQAGRIRLRLAPGDPAKGAWYAYRADARTLTVEAASAVALVRGAYAGLHAAGAWSVSWEGDRIALPAAFALMASGRVSTPFRHRAYLNTCAFGYTTPWWDWARWEREIDWMALHGVDLPLAMEGQEYIWQALWREEGLSAAEVAAYFSGPAFCPWQRMGNIEGYAAPLSADWIGKKHALQKRILARMRELGMQPILPAFGGYVPKAFALAHPEAKIHRMRPWSGFHETYWLDPTDPLFAPIARRFLELYTQAYGEGRYYLADSFNEMTPPVGDEAAPAQGAFSDAATAAAAASAAPPAVRDARLKTYGRALSDSIRRVKPDAVWVMQGWLFGADHAFWTKDAIAAFLSDVPDDGLMVLDIGNDRYADTWKTAGAFHGKAWIYGYVHNYGGSNPLYGHLEFYRADLQAVTTREDTGALTGFGLFPEGLETNSIVYAFAYDRAWAQRPGETVAQWMGGYLRARYGATSPPLEAAWADILAGTYRTRYWTTRWWRGEAGAYLLFKRPTLAAATFEGDPGDLKSLRRGVRRLAEEAPRLGSEPLYAHDLVQQTRHLTTLEVDGLLPPAIRAYRDGDRVLGDRLLARVTTLTLALDHLAGAENGGLAGWIDAAAAYADTSADRRAFLHDAKAQVTVWGGEGNLNDYASKAWQGLYRDYYLPRWTQFLGLLRRAQSGGAPFDASAWAAQASRWEHDWVERPTRYTPTPLPKPVEAALALLAQLEQP